MEVFPFTRAEALLLALDPTRVAALEGLINAGAAKLLEISEDFPLTERDSINAQIDAALEVYEEILDAIDEAHDGAIDLLDDDLFGEEFPEFDGYQIIGGDFELLPDEFTVPGEIVQFYTRVEGGLTSIPAIVIRAEVDPATDERVANLHVFSEQGCAIVIGVPQSDTPEADHFGWVPVNGVLPCEYTQDNCELCCE